MAIASETRKLLFRKTKRDLLRLASETSPDVVHRFRTTTRRLEVLLEFADNAAKNESKLLKQLSRVRKRAGRVRDLDVQIAALRSLKVSLEPRRKTMLLERLLTLREKHEDKLSKLLKKDDIRDMSKRLNRAFRDLDFRNDADPLRAARQMVADVRPVAASADEDLLHRYRVIVKRARYAAELAPPSPESEIFITQLQRMQDALGNWHDWMLLTQTAADQLGDVTRSSLVASLHTVTRGKLRHALNALSSKDANAAPPATDLVESPRAISSSAVQASATAA